MNPTAHFIQLIRYLFFEYEKASSFSTKSESLCLAWLVWYKSESLCLAGVGMNKSRCIQISHTLSHKLQHALFYLLIPHRFHLQPRMRACVRPPPSGQIKTVHALYLKDDFCGIKKRLHFVGRLFAVYSRSDKEAFRPFSVKQKVR